MAIKRLAFELQSTLTDLAGQAIGRSSIYELIAAAFGFRSYAALRATHVFAASGAIFEPQVDALHARANNIGLPVERCSAIASAVHDALRMAQIVVISIEELGAGLDALADEWSSCRENAQPWPVSGEVVSLVPNGDFDAADWLHDEVLLASLEDRAERNDMMSLYRLAQLHWLSCGGNEGSPHWYAERAKGEALNESQQAWAEQHANYLAYRQRLRAAAMAGHREAALRCAEEFDDPIFFEQPPTPVDADPREVAMLAERLDRSEDARYWLRIAASEGDFEAMRELIEVYDRHDPVACWTWHHLALRLDEDLTLDRHVAINEDGSLWDEDIGGPAYVGGEDGVVLPEIEHAQHEQAIREAEKLYAAILAG